MSRDVVEVFDLMQSEDTPQCRARTQCGWVDVVTCSGVTAFEIFMDEDRVDPSPTELPSTDVAAVTAEEDAEIEAWASRLTQDMEQYLTGGPGRASPVKAAVAPAVPEALAAPTALADSFVMAFVEASLSETVQMETTSAEISNQPEPMPTEAPAAAPKPLDLGDTSASDVISSYGPSNVISNAISEMMDSSSDDDEFLDVSSDHVSVSDEHVLEELSPTSPLAASPLATSPAPATRGELRRLQAQQRQWEQQHEAAASAEDMPGVGAEPEPEPEPEPELEPEPSVSTPDTSITAATGCTMGEALVPVGEAATQPTGRARAGRARKGRTRAVGVQEGGGARAGEAAAAVAGKVSELGEEVEAEVELPAVHGAFDMLDAMLNGGGLPDFEPELESGSLLALEPEPEPEPEPEREPGRVRTGRARVGRIRGGGHSRGVGQVAEEGGGTREGEEEVQKGPLDRPSFQAATAEIAASTEAGTEASELSRGEQVKALLSSESSAKAADMLSDIHASDENRLGVGAGSSQASNCLELPDSDTCILGPPASRGGAEGNPRSVFARKWRADSPKPHGRDIESPTRDRRPGPTEASRAKISSPGLSPIRKAIQDRRRSTVKAYDLSQSRKNLDELAQARQQMEDFLDLTRQTCETKRAAGPLSSSGRKSFGGSISSSISSPPRVASAVPGRYRPPSTMSSAAKKLFRAEPRGFGSTSPQRGERTAATTSSSTSATSPSRPPPRVAALAKAAVGQPRSRSPRSQRGFGSSSGRGLSPQPSEADSESPSRPPRVARLTRRASEQPSAKASTRSPVRKGFGSSTARGLSPDPDRSVTRRVSSPPSAAELFSICGDTAISTARKRVVIGRAATPTVPTGFGSSSRRNTSPTAWGRVEEPAGSTAGARSSSSSRRRPSPGSASSPAAVVFVARLSQPSKRAVSPRSKSSALPTGFGSSTARRTMLSHREPAAVGGGRGSPAETAARRRRSGSPRPAAGPPSATAAEQKVGVPSLPLKRASSRDRVVGAMPGVEAACHLPDLLDDEGNSLDQSEAADPTLGDTSFGSLESTSPLDQSSRLLQPTGSSRRRGKRKGAAVGGGGARPKSAGPRACSPAAVRSLDRLCRPTGTVRGHIIDAAAAGELENTFQPAVNDRSAQLVSRRQLDPATAPVHEKLQQEAATMSARRVELVERGLAAKEAELLIKPMPVSQFAGHVVPLCQHAAVRLPQSSFASASPDATDLPHRPCISQQECGSH